MQTRKEAYNGYTNYETWKVQLEVVDYIDCEEEVSWTHLAALAEETIYEGVEHASTAESIITSFLSEVNWRELADMHNERVKDLK